MNRNNWFENEFLPSMEKRMNNPKYPNSCILSQKQMDVCFKYMKAVQHKGDYGYHYTYEYRTMDKFYQMHFAGRYAFLNSVRQG